MRIAVLGGAGLTGRAAVRNLVENRDVSEVLVGDLNEKALRKLSNKVASSKLVTMQLDVRDVERVATFIRGCDAVINAVQYYHNIDVMYAALKVGVHYVDHGGLYRVTLKQLEMDHLFKSARQTALVGMGAQPGLTNIVARDAYEILDEVNAVYIKDGSRDLTEEPSPLKITWSLQTLLDEVVDAVIFHDGEYRSVPPLSMSEVVDFPQPIGRMETFVIIHSEVATLPRSFRDKELRACDWMEGSPDLPMIKRLADMGLASTEMLDVDGCRVSPRRFLIRLLDIGGLSGFRRKKHPMTGRSPGLLCRVRKVENQQNGFMT